MITNEQLVQWHKEFEIAKKNLDWIGNWDSYVIWRKHRPMHRKILITDFGGPGSHLYEDRLGWQYETKQEYKSNVSRVLFETIVTELWYNFSFYYVDNDTLYGFHMEGNPVCFKKLQREKNAPYIEWQLDPDTHPREGEEILVAYDAEDEEAIDSIWDTLKIDGKSLEEVLERSILYA